ncbi:hypothetical protein ACFFIO_12510 [Citricoccus parietis]|uniref:Septum formation-related domain-containing protein n=1 Tax=Citricoccus parietis TaxID=592307 RepID=A0ABV6F733_9MICC
MDTRPDGSGDESTPDVPEPTDPAGTPESPEASETADVAGSGDRHVPYLPPRQPDTAPAPRPRRQRGWWIAIGALVVVALAVFVLWPLLSSAQNDPSGETLEPGPTVSRNAEPGVDGIVAREVPPAQIVPGDCLTDFESVGEPSTVVECNRDHEAQLVGRKLWPTGRAFPEDMQAAAERFCAMIELDSAANAQVIVEISHPTQGTWDEGDRRVDCLAVAHDGTLNASLVAEPVLEDLTDQVDG